MTDKQIMIDRVDVSGCEFYSEKLSTMKGTGFISVAKSNGFCTHNIRGLDNSSCYDPHIEYAKCKNNNCYYKQLKRKEQENKDLRKDIKDIANLLDLDTGEEYNFGNIELEIKQLKAKEQECDQYKRELEHVKGLLTVSNKLNQALLNEREKLKRQLETKEQECKQQKAELELFKTSNQTTVDQLKAENETLFKAIEEVNKINNKLEAKNKELNEQQEKELQKLYNKFEGSSLIKARTPNERI